jgi:hypothetical protein
VTQPRVEVFPLSSNLLFPNQLVQTEQEEPVHLERTHTLTVLPHPRQHCTARSFLHTPSRTAPRIRLHRQTFSCNQGSYLTSQTRSARLGQHLLLAPDLSKRKPSRKLPRPDAQRLLGSTTLPANECFQTQRAYCFRLITSQNHITNRERTYKSKSMMKDVADGEETTKNGHRDLNIRLFPERLIDHLNSEIVSRTEFCSLSSGLPSKTNSSQDVPLLVLNI